MPACSLESLELSVILLTWNSLEMAKSCIRSIYEKTKGITFEIIVVDNGSTDSTVNWLESSYPEIRIIRNNRNLGVARARNQGLRAACARTCCILDIDTILLNDALTHLKYRLDSEKDIGIVAPRMFYADGTLQENCGQFPTITTKIRRLLTHGFARKRPKEYSLIGPEVISPIDVDYAIGACQMFGKDLLDEIGYLDERIFYGPEDVDFCLRAWKHGRRVVYEPSAEVLHYEQRLSYRNPLSKVARSNAMGLLYYFWKHRYLLRSPNLRGAPRG